MNHNKIKNRLLLEAGLIGWNLGRVSDLISNVKLVIQRLKEQDEMKTCDCCRTNEVVMTATYHDGGELRLCDACSRLLHDFISQRTSTKWSELFEEEKY